MSEKEPHEPHQEACSLIALAALEGALVRAERHGRVGDDLAKVRALLAEGVGVDRGGRELVVPAAAERLHLRGEGREESAEVEGRGKEGEPAAENTSSAEKRVVVSGVVSLLVRRSRTGKKGLSA